MLVVGELINASRKKVGEAIARRDADYIKKLARRQAEAGADFVDVNCGTFVEGEA
ncbi:MAG: methyltetrahydrofolate cobalamin methyltransferase, partial [Candidatus Latescibacterota bacterium]